MISMFICLNYVISGTENAIFLYEMVKNMFFSKMTFAILSQATAESQRFYHRTQNSFNRIQNSLMTIEVHNQCKF